MDWALRILRSSERESNTGIMGKLKSCFLSQGGMACQAKTIQIFPYLDFKTSFEDFDIFHIFSWTLLRLKVKID